MKFTFEALQDDRLIGGSSYFMDFGVMETQEDAAIAEGKLRSAFGDPAFASENAENSFNYIVRATADNGDCVVLSVYGMGVIHIGAARQDGFAQEAATALIGYVDSFSAADYSRTVYYLDYDLKIDIQVKNGKAAIVQSQMPEEKATELVCEWYS